MASPTSLASTATTITTTAARLIAAVPATVTSTGSMVNVIFFLIPLLSLVLAVLAVSRRSRPSRSPSGHRGGNSLGPRRQAHIAYAFCALLALLSTLAGALPFIYAGTGTASKAEAVVQGLLSFSLGLPVLHLPAYYDSDNDNADNSNSAPSKLSTRRIFETLYSSILVITLTGATLTALLQQLLPSSSAAAPIQSGLPLYLLPHALYLLYTLLALRRIACVLFRLLYPASPSFFSSSCFSSFLHSASSSSSRIRRSLARSTSRRPITIHISTQRTSIPFSAESISSSSPTSPSSAVSFPCPIAEIEQQPGGAIELALPKRKHKDTRSRLIDTANCSVLYQDKLKKNAGCLGSDSNLIAINKHRHRQKKSSSTSTSSSVDSASTTSTVAAFDQQQGRDSIANTPTSTTVTPGLRCSTSPLSSYPFITPPRAAHTATSASGAALDSASIPLLAPANISSISRKHAYSFPLPIADNNVSASTDSTDESPGIPLGVSSIVSVGDQSDLQLEDWDDSCNRQVGLRTTTTTRLAYSRTARTLLVTLAAVQVVLIVGYACGLGGDLPSSGTSLLPLRIIQVLCTVLAVTGTMAAYLLHAYNTHLSPSRSRSAAKSKSKSKSDPTSASTPLVTYSAQHTSHHYYNHSSTTTTNGVDITTTSSSSVIQIAETNPRPVLIQLAPPPPPRTRRKRADAFAAVPGHETSIPMRERSRMDVPRSVSISMSGTTTTSGFVDPSVRYSGDGDRIGLGDALDGWDAYSYSNPSSYPYQHQQHYQEHLGYDGTPFQNHISASSTVDDTQNSAAAYNARRLNQPITLTYEPPVMSGGLSMLETTETEGEVNDGEEDEDFEDVVDEGEDDIAGHGDGGMGVGMYMEELEGDLDLEDEMQKALSRSSSMATSMSGLRTERRRGHVRTHSTAKRRVDAGNGTGVTRAAPNRPKPSTKSKPKSKSSKAKKAMAEDPSMYIRKRGSMPVPPSATKRLFGFEFGWEHQAQVPVASSGAAVGGRGRRQSVGVVKKGRDVSGREVERGRESSFMDLQGTGIGANASTAVAVAVGVTTRKLKRHSTPAGSVYARSVIGGGVTRKQEKWEEVFGIGTPQAPSVVAPTVLKMDKENGMIAAGMKKLKKKRSQSVTRPGYADDVISSARTGILPDLPVAKTSNSRTSALPHATGSNSNFNIPASPSGPTMCDSEYGGNGNSRHANRGSLGSGSSIRRGLQLKRSFKLSVGRTLGPGLTLASAGAVDGGHEWEENRRKANRGREEAERRARRSDETIPTDEDADVDVDGEIRSIAAARLVSASIARVTPAATIVTAPSSAGLSTPSPPPSAYQPKPKSSPIDIAYPNMNSMQQGTGAARPVLPAIVTSPITIPIPTASAIPFPLSAPASRRPADGFSPVVQSPNRQQPHTSGSTWMPHPFADALEQPLPNVSSSKSYLTSGSEGRGAASIDDDVVQLEREMEEIRGRRGNGANPMDSPTTQLRELAEMAAAQAGEPLSISTPTSSPGLSSSMTPSVTSMFALARAQAQNVAPAPPAQTLPTEKDKEKAKMKLFGGGHFQKRQALSSPPVSRSDWGPQSSGAGNAGSTGGFLYRFPMIFPNTFAGSPPDSRTVVNGGATAQATPVPRPSTPRGGSTLRLSAMETVRSTFAIVGARMSNATSRMSVTSSAGASLRNGGGHGFGEMVLEDIDGDFMDLRDPFASPPPATNIATVAITTSGRRHSGKAARGDGDGERNRLEEADALKRKMSTWGRLPMPAPASAAGNGSSTVSGTAHKRHSFVNGRPVVRVVGKPSPGHHRKHKKEKRSRKVTLPSMSSAMSPVKVGSPEDADFGLEEALLSQRLLSRLDSDDWESRV